MACAAKGLHTCQRPRLLLPDQLPPAMPSPPSPRGLLGAFIICMSSFFVARSTGSKPQKASVAAAAPAAGTSAEMPIKHAGPADVEAAAGEDEEGEDRPLLAAVRDGLGRRRTASDQNVRASLGGK